jgi:hypothetical protein
MSASGQSLLHRGRVVPAVPPKVEVNLEHRGPVVPAVTPKARLPKSSTASIERYGAFSRTLVRRNRPSSEGF